ncbi:MAG: TetR family transcriptional regulator, partial [Butyrivibrio sp.]|nr:TetR family transcriptional regulator [Butyrivibrio sp.]
REIDRITIRQITDNCDYSPATFYRHFKDKYDLIAWDYAQNCAR